MICNARSTNKKHFADIVIVRLSLFIGEWAHRLFKSHGGVFFWGGGVILGKALLVNSFSKYLI